MIYFFFEVTSVTRLAVILAIKKCTIALIIHVFQSDQGLIPIQTWAHVRVGWAISVSQDLATLAVRRFVLCLRLF